MTAALPHFVYELIAADGSHLYVGCTASLPNRLGHHASTKEWAEEIVRVEASRYPDRESGLAAERELIELYQPPHNSVYTDDYGPAGWGRRRRLMAEAHAAGQVCRDRTCKAGCAARYHTEGRQCPSGIWGIDGRGCQECLDLTPLMIVERGEAEVTAWREIARRYGGKFANDLLGWTDSAIRSLAVVDSGLPLADLRDREHYEIDAMVQRIPQAQRAAS